MCKYSLVILIFAGFILSGCATVPYQPALVQPPGIYHIVGSGQTLYRIAQTYGVNMQEIIRLNSIPDPNQIGVGEELFIPGARTPLPVPFYRIPYLEPIEKLVGKKQYSAKWRYITIHHSGTIEGNAEVFDRNHRIRRLGGLFYHFVIGNGTGSQDGEVEVGWRWMRQKEVERKGDIQICLVGDFNRQEMSSAQHASLVKLLTILMKQYPIPLNHIRRHKDIENKITECPGRNFPFYRLLAELRKGS